MTSNTYEKLRQARVMKRVTLKDLAKKADLSYSYISQIERGDASPSLSSLDRLAKALDMTVWQLLKDDNEPGKPPDGDSRPNGPTNQEAVSDATPAKVRTGKLRKTKIVRHDMRRSIILPQSTVRYQMITPDINAALEVILVKAEVGATSGEAKFEHEGEECYLILEGQLEVSVGGETFHLETGDSLYFSCELPHGWKNVGDGDVSMLLVVTPPAY